MGRLLAHAGCYRVTYGFQPPQTAADAPPSKTVVVHETLANLSRLPADLLVLIEGYCQGKVPDLVRGGAPDGRLHVGPGYGLLAGLHALARELGIVRAVGESTRTQRLALYLIYARLAQQDSRLSAARASEDHAVREVLEVGAFDEDDLYAALEYLAAEQPVDGCYVVVSDLPAVAATTQQVHDRYLELTRVERDFRTVKTGLLEIRPAFLRRADRTRGHAVVSVLALKLARELERRVAAIGADGDGRRRAARRGAAGMPGRRRAGAMAAGGQLSGGADPGVGGAAQVGGPGVVSRKSKPAAAAQPTSRPHRPMSCAEILHPGILSPQGED